MDSSKGSESLLLLVKKAVDDLRARCGSAPSSNCKACMEDAAMMAVGRIEDVSELFAKFTMARSVLETFNDR